MLKIGAKGQNVSELQKMLSFLGYDLIVDGNFGKNTENAIKKYQKKVGALSDGIVSDSLLAHISKKYNEAVLLKPFQDEIEPEPIIYDFSINKSERLSDVQYFKQIFKKTQIFLHFTAGGPDAKNVINFWDDTSDRIATAYVIDRNTSEVFECFDPNFWGYHLGVKGSNGALDKASIGIEICSYGPLKLKNGEYFAWPNDYSTKKVSVSDVYSLTNPFRGFNYFEQFTENQIQTLETLICFLVEKYQIPVQYEFDYSWFEYNPDVIRKVLPGIWSHTTVRKDKSDLYPDHRIVEMLNRISNKYN